MTINDGTREVYWTEGRGRDSEKLFEVSPEEAHRIADILNGTYFHPVDEDLEEALEDARIRWLPVTDGSGADGRTSGDIGVRSRFGVSVLAVQRDYETVTDPGPTTAVRAGDVLVVVGSESDHAAFREFLAGEVR